MWQIAFERQGRGHFHGVCLRAIFGKFERERGEGASAGYSGTFIPA
jgi:hypothetical protein